MAHLHLDARAANESSIEDAGVVLSERSLTGMINLRGDPSNPALGLAVKRVTRVTLPVAVGIVEGNADDCHILGLGPNEWLVMTSARTETDIYPQLVKATADLHSAVTVVGEARTIIRLAGRHAGDVLAKGCALDLHPRTFSPGVCAQSILARADMTLHQIAADDKLGTASYDIIVQRSVAEYVWTWIEDAAREYGVRVAAARLCRAPFTRPAPQG